MNNQQPETALCGASANPSDGWTESVRTSLQVMMWTSAVSSGSVMLIAFVLPFVGGTRGDLQWLSVIRVAAGLLLVPFVFVFTRRPVVHGVWVPGESLATFLRILICLDFARRLWTMIQQLREDGFVLPGGFLFASLLEAVLLLVFFSYTRLLADRFGLNKQGRQLHYLGWASAILAVVFKINTLSVAQSVGLSLLAFGILSGGKVLLAVVVWVLALIVLLKTASRLRNATLGRCLCCGYIRDPLGSCCPECGNVVFERSVSKRPSSS